MKRVYEFVNRLRRGACVRSQKILVERRAHTRGQRVYVQRAGISRTRQQPSRAFAHEFLRLYVCLAHGGFRFSNPFDGSMLSRTRALSDVLENALDA